MPHCPNAEPPPVQIPRKSPDRPDGQPDFLAPKDHSPDHTASPDHRRNEYIPIAPSDHKHRVPYHLSKIFADGFRDAFILSPRQRHQLAPVYMHAKHIRFSTVDLNHRWQ